MATTTAAERAELVGQNAIENEMAEMKRVNYATYDAFLAEAVKRAMRNACVYVDGHNDIRSGEIERLGGRVSVSGLRAYLRRR